jgi:hypothetical protein
MKAASTATKFGLFIGLANMGWLYLAYFLGLHTSGIMVFQGFMLGWLIMNVVGFWLMLRTAKQLHPDLSYLDGLKAGMLAAAVTAVVAVVAQVGYYKVVHPAWPDVMAGQARDYFTEQGLSTEEVDAKVEEAKMTFTLGNYAVQSALAALFLGTLLSALMMIHFRKRPAAT